jgi:hypothetical protein
LRLSASDDWRELLVIANKGYVPGLQCRSSKPVEQARRKVVITPFTIGINEAGSVDIDASSRKTTGKSVTFNATHADVMHVVQIYRQKP